MNRGLKIEELRKTVREIMVFFDMFDYPLTLNEILALSGDMGVERDIEDILGSELEINTNGFFYYLKGRSDIITIRNQRSKVLNQYLSLSKRIIPFMKIVPFIKMVAVCNTVAFNNPDEDSDIDLFIITNDNRIFIARTLATVLLHLFGIRRHGDKVKGRFCLSFFISEGAMEMDKIKLKPEDIYLKFWIKTLKPVIGSTVYDRFLNENLWAKCGKVQIYSNKKFLMDKRDVLQGMGLIGERILSSRFGDFMESRLEKIHLKRYEKRKAILGKKADVIINRSMLKFHNIDRRADFNSNYFQKMKELGWSH